MINSVRGCDVIALPVNTNPNDPPTLLSKVELKVRGCVCCSRPGWYPLFFCKVCAAFRVVTWGSVQSFSWEANGYSGGQKIPLLWKPMIHYHIYRGPLNEPHKSCLLPLTVYFNGHLNIFNIILLSTALFSLWSWSLRPKFYIYIYIHTHTHRSAKKNVYTL